MREYKQMYYIGPDKAPHYSALEILQFYMCGWAGDLADMVTWCDTVDRPKETRHTRRLCGPVPADGVLWTCARWKSNLTQPTEYILWKFEYSCWKRETSKRMILILWVSFCVCPQMKLFLVEYVQIRKRI